MENSSFLLRLSKSKFALIIIVIVIISSGVASNYVNNYIFFELGPDRVVEAIRLDGKPREFIPFSKLDSYNIQTIFNSSTGVEISSKVYYEIWELIRSYDTQNVEYGDDYYRLQFNFVGDTDEVQHSVPLALIILSSVIFLILAIAGILLFTIVLINIVKILRRSGVL